MVELEATTGGTGLGEVAQRAGRQVVDDVDDVALGDEPIDEVRADEPGAPDDQRVHGSDVGWAPSTSVVPAATTPVSPTMLSHTVAASWTTPMTTERSTW